LNIIYHTVSYHIPLMAELSQGWNRQA